MSEKMLRRPAVEEMTGLSRSSIYDMMANGDFPRPVKLSARRVAWRESEVQHWINDREEATAA